MMKPLMMIVRTIKLCVSNEVVKRGGINEG